MDLPALFVEWCRWALVSACPAQWISGRSRLAIHPDVLELFLRRSSDQPRDAPGGSDKLEKGNPGFAPSRLLPEEYRPGTGRQPPNLPPRVPGTFGFPYNGTYSNFPSSTN